MDKHFLMKKRKNVIDEPFGFSIKNNTLSFFAKQTLTKQEIKNLKGGSTVIDEPFDC